mgnify:CR=1 FL=1
MKKHLLLLAMTLFALPCVYAQDEGGDETPEIVYTKSLLSSINDAKNLVASSHYTVGKDGLQNTINQIEGAISSFTTNLEVSDAMQTLQSAIDEFVGANGHADATEKVLNNSFDKDGNNSKTITSWTVQNFKQNRRSVSYMTTRSGYSIANFVEQWIAAGSGPLAGSGSVSQVVTGLPAGHYRLTADIFAHNQKYDNTCEEAVGIQLFANESVCEVGMTGNSDTEGAAFSVEFDVAEGENPTIGFRFENTNVNWLGWDNVTLLFIGDPDVYNSIVDAEKLAAIKEALNTTLSTATEALAREDAPFYRTELQNTITEVTALLETGSLDELTEAKERLDGDLKKFNDYNKHYTDLKAAIEQAEALIAAGEMTEGVAEFQDAINTAKTQLAQAATDFATDADGGVAFVDAVLADLKEAESTFRVKNASYANPANVITNGSMNSTDGWDILVPGSNPGLHINTSGTVTNFSKPFMECWVNNTNYGQENYARQTVNALPNGATLPSGYYVLKAAALATRQDQADLQVSGVTLRLQDQEVAVHTANGVANIYTIGFEKAEAGGELTFGLFIDESTDANWIAWDEVELQFVGDKDKYIADYTAAVLGESLNELKATLDEVLKAVEEVDMNGIDFEETDLYMAIEDARYALENPTDAELVTKENVQLLTKTLKEELVKFYTSGVSPKEGHTFDFTSMIQNADFDVAPGDEWTVETEGGVLPGGTDCVNWWFGSSGPSETTQEFSQTITGMPAGNYLLDVNAAIRVDMNYSTANYTAENLPNYVTMCKVYANNDSTDVHPFFYEDEALGLTLENMLLMTNDYDYRHGNGSLIDDMLKGTDYYHSYVPFKLDERGSVKVGFRIELPTKAGQMPFIDYFHLSFFGKFDPVIPGGSTDGIATVVKNNEKVPAGIYNLKGQLVRGTANTEGLAKGLYIIGGKKVVIR